MEVGSGPRRTATLPLPDVAPEVFERHLQAARKRRGETAPEKIVAAVRRAIDMPFADAVAYARADFLIGDQELQLTELELVEPSLFFRHSRVAADRLADAISNLLSRE